MKKSAKKNRRSLKPGSALVFVIVAMIILAVLGMALLKVSEGARQRAVFAKTESAALGAAEAACEKAIFWMSQQVDMLDTLDDPQASGTVTFPDSSAQYQVTLANFLGSCPIYRVCTQGTSGIYQRTLDIYVSQVVGGWEMGLCRVPSGTTTTDPVYFMSGETIDMPLHINRYNDSPDARDINISGSPSFLALVGMGESRYSSGGSDKYSSVMNLFRDKIVFNQPNSRITNQQSITTKITRFKNSTNPAYIYTPTINSSITLSNKAPAVQLEFYVGKDNNGYVRITEDCTVIGYQKTGSTWDYIIDPAGSGSTYKKYPIYGYHYIPSASAKRYTRRTDNPDDPIYVSQQFGGYESQPGAQIFVDGNVVIGTAGENAPALGQINTVRGRIVVAATGNIWIANTLKVAGDHDGNNMPVTDNPNVIGLVSTGTVKVVDTGMTTNGLLTKPSTTLGGDNYQPIANLDHSSKPAAWDRELPQQMVIEAAITAGGGGFGAENVPRGTGTGRETYTSGVQDNLILRGSLAEAVRSVVGIGQTAGYKKQYYYDRRLMQGILPGDIWLKGKYVPIPAGWTESKSVLASGK